MQAKDFKKAIELQVFTNPLIPRSMLNQAFPPPIATTQTRYQVAVPKLNNTDN